MPFDFPASPTLGQIYSPLSGLNYTWDGEKWVTSGTVALNLPSMPGGRLTPTTGVPVPVSAVAAGANIYYSPYISPYIPIFDGNVMVPTLFNELMNVLSNTTDNPAACVANKNYDLFVWSKAGVPTLSRGPAWTNDTTRASGISRTSGIWTNTSAITNGPASNRGTYVGTFRTNSAGTLDWTLGSSASGGSPGILSVWNAYNRVRQIGICVDTTANWAPPSSADRSLNNSGQNRHYFVRGLDEEPVVLSFATRTFAAAGQNIHLYLNLDGTTSGTGSSLQGRLASAASASPATNEDDIGGFTTFTRPSIGWHFIQACEINSATTSNAVYGGAYMQYMIDAMM